MDTAFTDILRPFLKFAGDSELTAQSRLRELGLDSMQAIQLLFAIEDNCDVSLPDELLSDATFETAGSLWEAVTQLTAGVRS
ncbi:phosphopantetheine-binding protein [Streptomyces olivaceus]|uniref:phosphopantetheine-binding protein n=1 Tax=Streptomyces olivaceus TaxID=47716 RepID=UPI00362CF64B